MTDDHGEQRETRSSVLIFAEITRQNGAVGEHRVRNLSRHGLCVDNDGSFSRGERLDVRMGVLAAVPATVIWLRRDLAGLHLDQPVSLADARRPRAIRAGVSAGWVEEVPDPYRHMPTRSSRPAINPIK